MPTLVPNPVFYYLKTRWILEWVINVRKVPDRWYISLKEKKSEILFAFHSRNFLKLCTCVKKHNHHEHMIVKKWRIPELSKLSHYSKIFLYRKIYRLATPEQREECRMLLSNVIFCVLILIIINVLIWKKRSFLHLCGISSYLKEAEGNPELVRPPVVPSTSITLEMYFWKIIGMEMMF